MLLGETGFWIAIIGVVMATGSALIGIWLKGRSSVATIFVVMGGLVGIAGTISDRYDTDRDRTQLHGELNASLRIEGQLRAATASIQTTSNTLSKRTQVTLLTARGINQQSHDILKTVGQNLATTRSVAVQSRHVVAETGIVAADTRQIADRAQRLQIAAAESLSGIARLNTPFSNVFAIYIVHFPIGDPSLAKFREVVFAAVRAGGSAAVPASFLLEHLPSNDPGAQFLRGTGLIVEMYRTPLRSPSYGDAHVSRLYAGESPDFVLLGRDLSGIPYPVVTPLPNIPFSVQVSARDWKTFDNATAFVSVYGDSLTMDRRTGRLDSLADLPGSEMFVHLNPAWPLPLVDSSLVRLAQLDSVHLIINGAWYRINVHKADVGQGPWFTYYEVHVPRFWHPLHYELP